MNTLLKLLGIFTLVLTIPFLSTSAKADEHTHAEEAAHDAAQGHAGMDPAVMAQIMKLAAPAEEHALLAKLAGEWSYTSKMWMDPNLEPHEASGSSSNKMILGDRFLKSEVAGTMEMDGMTMPFEGLWLQGYDNVEKKYNSFWVDNMTTTMVRGHGSYDEATKTIAETGELHCPMRGGKMDYRSEVKFIDDNTYEYNMYGPDKDGQEFKMLELRYARK